MGNCPLISIIVPLYNVASFLERSLNSIILQTYRNLEIILVDDGSMDDSGVICDEYLKQDNRIVVIHKENGGPSSARNAGLEIASGQMISFIDSDDYVELDLYEKIVKLFIENTDIDIIQFNIIWRNSELSLVKPLFAETTKNQVFSSIISLKNLLECHILTGYVTNKVYRSDTIKSIRFIDGIVTEDMIFNYLAFGSAKRILCINEKKYNYMLHEGSISIGKICKNDINTFWQLEKMKMEEKNEQLIEPWTIYQLIFSSILYDKMIKHGYEDIEFMKNVLQVIKRNYYSINDRKIINIKTRVMINFLLLNEKMYNRFILGRYHKKVSL